MLDIEYKDGKVIASSDLVHRLVKDSGLRSKKRRSIMKRFKLIINKALRNWLDEQEESGE